MHASPATCALLKVLLLDSALLQEEDARRANRHGYSRHEKALPLNTRADTQRALSLLVPLAPGRTVSIARHPVTLTPVGHLLGACAVTLQEPGRAGRRLVFSGDLGRQHDLLMPPPEAVTRADVLLVESTYGNRLHPAEDGAAKLADIVQGTLQRGGSVLLPAFAVGRAQALPLSALALVLLPLAPAAPLAWLGGMAPRTMLLTVLLILALQAAGHVALRLLGVRAGLALSGLYSGFVSSTFTIAAMGAPARAEPAQQRLGDAGLLLGTALAAIADAHSPVAALATFHGSGRAGHLARLRPRRQRDPAPGHAGRGVGQRLHALVDGAR